MRGLPTKRFSRFHAGKRDVEHRKGECAAFGKADSMLATSQEVRWGRGKQCDLSLTFMLEIFYVCRSLERNGRVFEFLSSFNFRKEFFLLFSSFEFFFCLSLLFINGLFCLNCEHEPVLLNKWKDP